MRKLGNKETIFSIQSGLCVTQAGLTMLGAKNITMLQNFLMLNISQKYQAVQACRATGHWDTIFLEIFPVEKVLNEILVAGSSAPQVLGSDALAGADSRSLLKVRRSNLRQTNFRRS